MKKKMAILLLGIIVAVAVLAGCGGKKEAGSPVVGDYKLASVESGGMTVDVDEYKEMMGDDSPLWFIFAAVLNFGNAVRLVKRVPMDGLKD